MAGSLISNNTTIKMSGGSTDAAGGSFSTSASEYAILTMSSSAASNTIQIGNFIHTTASGATIETYYIPPGVTITWTQNSGNIYVSYVIFTNSP